MRPLKRPRTQPVLLLVMCGVFLTTMDSGMVNIALPSMMRDLGLSFRQVEGVVSIYLVTITASLIFWGKFSDRVGRGRVYLGGLLLFGLGELACFSASSYYSLIMSRFIQGTGGAMMMATGPAIIRATFPKRELGSGLGRVGIATACGLLSGPIVGGILVDLYSWKAIFLAGMPAAFGIACGGYLFLRYSLGIRRKKNLFSYDWKGAVLWTLIVVAGFGILHGIGQVPRLYLIALFGTLVWLVRLFWNHEKRVEQPLLPVKEIRQRYYWVAVITAGLSFGILFTVLILLPFYLEYVQGKTAAEVGQTMMAVPVTLLILSPLCGKLYDRIGARLLTTLGLLTCTLTLLSFGFLTTETTSWEIVVRLLALGGGQSVFLSPNSASVLSRVRDDLAGTSAGILATARNLGMMTGAASAMGLLSLWYYGFTNEILLPQGRGTWAFETDLLLSALRATFLSISAVGLLATCISASRRY